MEESIKLAKWRDLTLDYLKAFAIILVVLGHSLQYGLGEPNDGIFDNWLMKFIYSFHMPLFMMISGYLFGFSVKKHSFQENLLEKLKSLLVPIAIWSIPVTIIDIVKYSPERLNPWDFLKSYLNEFIGQFWFLWAVLLCSVIVLIANRFLKDSIIVYIIIFILTFIIPNIIMVDELYRFMFPLFVLAYFISKHSILKDLSKQKIYATTLISMVVFIVLLFFYNQESYIYISGHSLIHKQNWLHQLFVDIYRIFIGIAGSAFFWGLFSIISKYIKGFLSKVLMCLGTNTMGIYIISWFFSVYLLPEVVKEYIGLNYGVVLLETILTSALCLILVFLIKKVKFLNKLLLGGR